MRILKLAFFSLFIIWGNIFAQINLDHSLVAYYPFNGNANDESGNGNHGTVMGASLTTDRFGNNNSAYYFDGVNDLINLGDVLNDVSIPFSISLWYFKSQYGTKGWDFIISDNPSKINDRYYGFWLGKHPNENTVNLGYGDGLGIGSWYRRSKVSSSSYPLNSWTHLVAIVRGKTDMTIYFNSIDDGGRYSGTSNEDMAHNSRPAIIGFRIVDDIVYFEGILDDIRIYNRALNKEEVDSLYNEILNPYINVDKKDAYPGDTIIVPVSVKFPYYFSCSSVEIQLSGYFNKLDFIEVVIDSSLTSGWLVQTNETGQVLSVALAGDEEIIDEGIVCWLKFSVPDNAAGFIPITIESALFNEISIPSILTSGGINVQQLIPNYGDVSLNGEIHAYDASLILKYLVDKIDLNAQQLLNANVSLDTTVSALDASIILQYVVGIISILPYDTSAGLLVASGDIGMNDDFIKPGENISVPLNLINGNNILSFESVITYNPDHLTFNEIIWSSFLDGFTIETNIENGKIKIAGANSVPDGQKGVFADLQFTVNQNFNDNETFVRLQKMRWNEGQLLENVATARLMKSTSTKEHYSEITDEFALNQNYPNPFNPTTIISYQLPKSVFVNILIYSLSGQLIETLVNEHKNAGYHSFEWNAKNVSSGLYFYKFTAGEYSSVKKCLVIR